MSEKNKRNLWVNLINWDNVISFSQIFYKRKISELDKEKAIESLESKISADTIISLEITEIEEWIIKEVGSVFKKEVEIETIHDLYQGFMETGAFGDVNSPQTMSKGDLEARIRDEMMKGGKIGMPSPEMLNDFLSKLQSGIESDGENEDDPNGLGGLLDMFGGFGRNKKKKDDDKNSETFYI